MKLFLKERQDNWKESGERGRKLISAETGVVNIGSFLPQARGFSSKRSFSEVALGSGRNLGHSMAIVIILIGSWGRSRLISVSILRLLRVELVGRPVAELAILFLVAVERIGAGRHRDVGREGVGGFVEAVVPVSIDSLGFAVRRSHDEHV